MERTGYVMLLKVISLLKVELSHCADDGDDGCTKALYTGVSTIHISSIGRCKRNSQCTLTFGRNNGIRVTRISFPQSAVRQIPTSACPITSSRGGLAL